MRTYVIAFIPIYFEIVRADARETPAVMLSPQFELEDRQSQSEPPFWTWFVDNARLERICVT
jgi:hypothetical protein